MYSTAVGATPIPPPDLSAPKDTATNTTKDVSDLKKALGVPTPAPVPASSTTTTTAVPVPVPVSISGSSTSSTGSSDQAELKKKLEAQMKARSGQASGSITIGGGGGGHNSDLSPIKPPANDRKRDRPNRDTYTYSTNSKINTNNTMFESDRISSLSIQQQGVGQQLQQRDTRPPMPPQPTTNTRGGVYKGHNSDPQYPPPYSNTRGGQQPQPQPYTTSGGQNYAQGPMPNNNNRPPPPPPADNKRTRRSN